MGSRASIRVTESRRRRQQRSQPSRSEPAFVPSKIQVFRTACEENEWDYTEDWYEQDYRAKAWRGENAQERIIVIWRDRYFSADESSYELVNVRTKRINNQAEAVRFLRENPDYTFAKDEEGRNLIVRDVFDWSGYEDAEIAKSLAGRTLTWQNSFTGEYDRGAVPRRGNWTAVKRSSEGIPYITFADAGGMGFRSVHLHAIVKIK